ncbi:hypothetical protein [Streptomyces mirabilis]|uniref:Uncharacterized protein n=1 Tax=Streptomyces mirabilis TaxID=68239 RepID=A0ABU3V1X9_9ACTN|nr:hypothetical protein [Streptomyces mirabilis]MDU8999995.1 hypothetical protein [Streptomyces mirabilis]
MRATPENNGVRTEVDVANTYERDATYSIQKPLSYRMCSLSFRCSGMVSVSSWEGSGDQFVLDDAG